MAKKIFIVGFAMIVLCLCCGICFAAEDNSVNLGNEIMQSIDKTGTSMNNVISGNWTNNGNNKAQHDGNGMMRDDMRKMDGEVMTDNGNYNTTRTTTEGTATNAMSTMSTTTWMWIILVVAAVIIIAAIWYYATQNSD